MIGGLDPLIVFRFPANIAAKVPGYNALAGVPYLGEALTEIGDPIPLYLSERLTGIMIQDESKAIDIDTEVQARNDGKPPNLSQRAVNSLVTVNLACQKTSVFLAVLLAMNDRVFEKVASKEYSIDYFNGPTTVIGGLLQGFNTSLGMDNDLVHISIQISRASQKSTQPTTSNETLSKVTGTTPLTGGQ